MLTKLYGHYLLSDLNSLSNISRVLLSIKFEWSKLSCVHVIGLHSHNLSTDIFVIGHIYYQWLQQSPLGNTTVHLKAAFTILTNWL